jgi:hypothetical protein
VRQGGGSLTLPLYDNIRTVNDLATGSGLVKPSDFDNEALNHLQPAIFVATPVMNSADSVRIPFLPPLPGSRTAVVWGGGWNNASVWPTGWRESRLLADGDPAIVPNQGSWFCPVHECAPLRRGDWMFFRPRQSDRILQFDALITVRGSRVTGTWKPLERRY